MSYATDADLLTYVSAASAVDPALRGFALDDAREAIDERMFRGQTRRAHAMLAAHYLATMPNSGLQSSPAIASRKAGEVAVTYAVRPARDNFDSTSFGSAFRQIWDSIPHGPEAV